MDKALDCHWNSQHKGKKLPGALRLNFKNRICVWNEKLSSVSRHFTQHRDSNWQKICPTLEEHVVELFSESKARATCEIMGTSYPTKRDRRIFCWKPIIMSLILLFYIYFCSHLLFLDDRWKNCSAIGMLKRY